MGWAQGAGLGRMQGKTTDQGAKEFASFSPVNVTMYPELLSFHTSITTQVKLTDLTWLDFCIFLITELRERGERKVED